MKIKLRSLYTWLFCICVTVGTVCAAPDTVPLKDEEVMTLVFCAMGVFGGIAYWLTGKAFAAMKAKRNPPADWVEANGNTERPAEEVPPAAAPAEEVAAAEAQAAPSPKPEQKPRTGQPSKNKSKKK